MIIDDLEHIHRLDSQDMHGEILRLPEQLEKAWELGQAYPLPDAGRTERVIVAGMGGSAIGADLLAALAAPDCRVPVMTLRDYSLPGWAAGPETLVIASSHSGYTEETLAAYRQARQRGCSLMAISTGGELESEAKRDGAAHWRFEHRGQPRAGIGYSFGLLLAAFARLGLVPDPSADLAETIGVLKAQAEQLQAPVPAVQNPGKRYAGQLMGRSFVVFGAEFLAPVARRWKTQINEHAKAWAQFEEIPEADHNALVGTAVPETLTRASFAMFLVAPSYSPRNALRMELTRKTCMLEGISTDFYLAQGASRMAQQWTALQFGDFVAYYLAIAYGIDPTPVEGLVMFKDEMARFE